MTTQSGSSPQLRLVMSLQAATNTHILLAQTIDQSQNGSSGNREQPRRPADLGHTLLGNLGNDPTIDKGYQPLARRVSSRDTIKTVKASASPTTQPKPSHYTSGFLADGILNSPIFSISRVSQQSWQTSRPLNGPNLRRSQYRTTARECPPRA